MIVPPSSLAHVLYRTRRFKEMLSWYTTVFGAKIQLENPALAFLTFDDDHHRFAFANLDVIGPESDHKDDRGTVGVDHVAYSYPNLHALMENYAHFKQEGILPYWCVHHGVTASLYYADPDGNQMEFTVDAFPTKAEGYAYIHGPGMEENPVGVEYDPEDWLSKLRNGTPETELLKFDTQGTVSPIRGQLADISAS